MVAREGLEPPPPAFSGAALGGEIGAPFMPAFELLPQESNNLRLVLQHLSPVLSGFRTQFVPRLCPRGAIHGQIIPTHRKEIHAERKRDTSEEATWT